MNNSHKNIVGISDFNLDSTALLVIGGMVIPAAQEECFIHVKQMLDFPANTDKYWLEVAGSCYITFERVRY